MESPKQSIKQKVEQARTGRLSDAEVQHLKRLGVYVPHSRRSLSPIERLVTWWEMSSMEHFRDVISVTASGLLILALVGWWADRQNRQQNQVFTTWGVVRNAAGDQSGVSKIAVERF